jgi:hypothetical protein
LENLDSQGRGALEDLTSQRPDRSASIIDAVRCLYQRAGAFDEARTLVAKHRQRAHEIAATVSPPPLAQLLHFLADTALEG